MELSIKDVREVFLDLIEKKVAREYADRWAYARMQAFDANDLVFIPSTDEELLWEAVQYLYGVDTKVASDEYMHSIGEIKIKYQSCWGEANQSL